MSSSSLNVCTPAPSHLLLEAPVSWWPAFSHLHLYPANPVRSLLAALTRSAASIEDSVFSHHCYLLSHSLGRSLFATATWSRQDDTDSEAAVASVEVFNPYGGNRVRFRCRHIPSTISPRYGESLQWSASAEDGPRNPAAQLASYEDVVAFVPTVTRYDDRTEESASMRDSEDAEVVEKGSAVALTERLLAVFHGKLQKRSKALASVLIRSDQGNASSEGIQRALHVLCDRLHDTALKVSRSKKTNERSNVVFLPDYRYLDLAPLMTLTSEEVRRTVQCTLRPLPTIPLESRAHVAGRPTSAALVVVQIANIDLLSDYDSTQAAIVVYELLHATEIIGLQTTMATDAASARLVIVSSGSHPEALPSALLMRVAQHIVDEGATGVEPERGVETSHAVPHGPTNNGSCEEKQTAFRHLFGVMDAVESLERLVLWPLRNLEQLRNLRVRCPKGALICGPTGSGKTALLAALARNLVTTAPMHPGKPPASSSGGINVMMVDCLTMLEKEVGQSEKNISSLFRTARTRAPTVLFLDNLDSLAPPRHKQTRETSMATDRTLSTLLTEMDGVTSGSEWDAVVIIIASAPSREQLDPAVCRPGRLDIHITLPQPTVSEVAAFVAERLASSLRTVVSLSEDNLSRMMDIVSETITAELGAGTEGKGSLHANSLTMADGSAVFRNMIIMLHDAAQASLAQSETHNDAVFREMGRIACDEHALESLMRAAAQLNGVM